MKQYKVLIVGAGKIGAFFDKPDDDKILTHAHAFYNSDKFLLMGFYDEDYEKSVKAAKTWGGTAYDRLDEALKESEVVCCAVPDEYHYEILKKVAESEIKLVFAEKPITRTKSQAADLIRLYENKGIPVAVNYTRRYLKEFLELKTEIPSFGRFIRGTGYYGKGLLHNGSHMLNLIEMLLGKITDIRYLHAITDFYEEDKSYDLDLTAGMGKVSLYAIDCRAVTIFELELFFEKKRIRIINGGTEIEYYSVKESPVYKDYFNYIKENTVKVDMDSAFSNAVHNLYHHLEDSETLFCDIKEAASLLSYCIPQEASVKERKLSQNREVDTKKGSHSEPN